MKSGNSRKRSFLTRLALTGLVSTLAVGGLLMVAAIQDSAPAYAQRASIAGKCVTPTPDDDTYDSYAASHSGNGQHNQGHCAEATPVSDSGQPDLAITKTTEEGNDFTVGQTVTFDVQVTNVSDDDIESNITVSDKLPAGLKNITVDGGSDWTVSPTTSATSPVQITATYKGTFPVEGGQSLPVIKIRGTLTSQAVPGLTNVATVSSPSDKNPANNTASKSINVKDEQHNQHPQHPDNPQQPQKPEVPVLPMTGSDPNASV